MQSALVAVAALCLCYFPLVNMIAIDNGLTGDPVVDCQDTMVSLTFTTKKPFTGRVYVKGLADDDRCSQNFATNPDQSKFSMMIASGGCNMQRQRVSGQLEGLMFSLVIVVSFHGTFVTKVDRAYRCMCFFRNIKRVTNFLDMSMLPTTELLDTFKTPTCTYSIHSGSVDGPLVRYGKIGDKIYHVWECDDPTQGFLVHSCWVNDGRGRKFDLLDIDGCAIDPVIQPDVKYESNLRKASVETHGYKFSDSSVLDYQCVLELCKIAQGECNGLAPPQCGRGKRDTNTILVKAKKPIADRDFKDNELDVATSMNMIETLDDELNPATGRPDRSLMDYLNRPRSSYRLPGISSALDNDQLCLSTPAFGILLALVVILFLATVVVAFMLCSRRSKL